MAFEGMVTYISRVITLLVVVMAAAATTAAAAEVFVLTRHDDFQRCNTWCGSGRSLTTRLRKGDIRMAMEDFPKGVFPSRLVLQAVEDAISVMMRDGLVVVLHDGQSNTENVLQGVLASLGVQLILVDLGYPGVTEAVWLGDFNSAFYVHLLIFDDPATVEDFLEWVPEHTWAPRQLLLLNINWSLNATTILSHPRLRHSSFLTLLQPHLKIGGEPAYRILTYETFKPGNKIVHRGNLSPSSSFSSLFPDRFSTFHGHHFQISSWIDDFPYIIKGETLNDTYGIGVNMLNDIANIYNFTYQLSEQSEDGMWGDLSNGSWRGMIGEVKRGDRDFCINVMSITRDQFRAVDFSVPYNVDGFSFLLRNPLPPPRWWSIVFPLSWEAWIAVLVCVLTLPWPLFLLVKLDVASPSQVHRESKVSLNRMYLEVMKIVLHQNSMQPSSVTSVRIFLGVWFLAAMVLFISYTGNLVAYITVPAKPQMLTMVDQLAEADVMGASFPYTPRPGRHPGPDQELRPLDPCFSLFETSSG
ncbi:ionotropic receptor 21a-like isoform X2 [Portunus trituberculatus]|uniref:ionotropic receptor 21a-like isoform X2 n=1 Tax=Portunus trituberculatus TaxID=210409 RepID=UPI001E1D0223|nr:ionotropic receptor 21a-like isoform X2 [Portunus trituberculatus]